MDSLPKTRILNFNSDTLQYLRKLYDLDKPGRLEEAINILVNWLQKQDHLIKKEYSHEYLERLIILNKGSVERVKNKLDKMSTFKTLLPNFYEAVDPRSSVTFDVIFCNILPKMTEDHNRILIFKNAGQRNDSGFLDVFKYMIMICEYLQAHDYFNGVVSILDHTENNIIEMVKAINLVEIRQIATIVMEGYGMRLKALHFLTPSKAIEGFITIIKQVLSPKISERIHVHKNIETLYEFVPKEILPVDFGGEEKSIKELSEDLRDELCSTKFMEYYNEMKQASTNEAYRCVDKFHENYMGMPGSFRKLNMD